jgi:hypothetical protein
MHSFTAMIHGSPVARSQQAPRVSRPPATLWNRCQMTWCQTRGSWGRNQPGARDAFSDELRLPKLGIAGSNPRPGRHGSRSSRAMANDSNDVRPADEAPAFDRRASTLAAESRWRAAVPGLQRRLRSFSGDSSRLSRRRIDSIKRPICGNRSGTAISSRALWLRYSRPSSSFGRSPALGASADHDLSGQAKTQFNGETENRRDRCARRLRVRRRLITTVQLEPRSDPWLFLVCEAPVFIAGISTVLAITISARF